MSLDEATIQEIVRRVLTVAQPDKIILFGSAATGQMTKDSDIDLLVVEPKPEDDIAESVRIRRAIGSIGYSVDVILITTQEFEEGKDVVGTMAYQPAREGRLVHPPIRPREVVEHETARRWASRGQEEFAVAELGLTMEPPYEEAAAFHAHESAENLLKAFLVRHQVPFGKMHDLGEVLDLLAGIDPPLAASLREAEALTAYTIEVLSPHEGPDITVEDAGRAIALASEVRDAILAALQPYLEQA